MNEINNPPVRTYYILLDNERTEVKAFGYVNPGQNLTTIWLIDEYTNLQEWLAALLAWGIIPDLDENGNLQQ